MVRCYSQLGLQVHHVHREDGNGLENAEVLCARCYPCTATGSQDRKPPDFDEATRAVAKVLAGNRCQCVRATCGFH